MPRAFLITAIFMAALFAAGCATSPYPPPNLFGVKLGMDKRDVESLLEGNHGLARDEEGAGGAKQTWELEDASFQWLVLRYTPELTVLWVTAKTRPGGKPVRYRDVGKLQKADSTGMYFYKWSVPATTEEPGYLVLAQGTDPEELFAVSLFNPFGGTEEEDPFRDVPTGSP